MKLLISCLFFLFASLGHAAETRFDSVYFFQEEEVLKEKQVNFQDFARFNRSVQSAVWKALKKVSMPASAGYLVVAVRADGKIAAWLDMQPALHEYYDAAVTEAVSKLRPFALSDGIVVFGMKMAVNTAVFTSKAKPQPKDWADAQKAAADPDDIEAIVQAAWPE
ncbi:hypothetical protein [Undibacterium terreum]|uniref:Uncharacterized protein n=1 Tax=Undibacterium terreum TaxID=1224302 RepID=A0A916XR98_9BURK|nr:hypothetical protein [Undibacterium terreum]GGC95344.1 hypothetical protein GCM10011396_48360 [Undibacterium terreum]